MDWQAFWLTIRLAVWVAVILAVFRPSHRVLACVFAMAWEVSDRSVGRSTHRLAAHRVGILCAGCARLAQSHRKVVDRPHLTSPGIYLRRPAGRVGDLQSAVHGAAAGGGILRRGSQVAAGLCHFGCFSAENISAHHSSSIGMPGSDHRHCADIRAHHGRVRSRADGRRQHPRSNADGSIESTTKCRCSTMRRQTRPRWSCC